MKHTIAQNKQLFNVKEIADSVDLDALADGQFGVFAVGATTSLPANTVYAGLPAEFRFISKLNGKTYFSFDTIKKSELRNVISKDYQAEIVNMWETTIESCECIETALIKIGLDEESLIRQNGLTWTDTDAMVVDASNVLKCACSCTGKKVYDNNIMTKDIVNKINSVDSRFYKASVKLILDDVTAYADQAALDTANATPTQGDLATLNDAETIVMYDGTAWQVVGNQDTGVITDVDTFIAINKEVNTDDDETNDGPLLTIQIEGLPATVKDYKDLDVNHIFPRGVRLSPTITLNNGNSSSVFTETQELQYELGAGADVRAEEFEAMSLYTNLNHYPQLHDGIAADGLVYQFENKKKYNTLDFEFYTDKVLKNSGDKRSFGVMLGTESSSVFAALEALLEA